MQSMHMPAADLPKTPMFLHPDIVIANLFCLGLVWLHPWSRGLEGILEDSDL